MMNTGEGRNGPNVRVMLVDDSPIAVNALKKMLASESGIEVVATARNGAEALDLIPEIDPEIICTDLYMPVVDGLELTREVMDRYPRPILVISVGVREEEPRNAFDLLEAGALDVFSKPRAGLDPRNRELASELAHRIRRLAGVTVFRRPRARPQRAWGGVEVKGVGRQPVELVAIGASTGGPQALLSVLPRLPRGFPVPVVCVQHIGEGFLKGLVEWLDSRCQLRAKTAEDGESPQAGFIYFAPEGRHLAIADDGLLAYRTSDPVKGHRPSVDIMMASAAEHFGGGALGLLLSGMGCDGAEGLLAIRKAGGITLAQDAETSVVSGMAECAQSRGAVGHLLPLQEIAPMLLEAVER